ncbi:MAG: hypothetical protein NC489_40635 [Ruminococcus flavefaciens]|nr:hypothetical protein [Ruminococcus flavefaciens]
MDAIYVEQIDTYPEEIIECIKEYSDYLQRYIYRGVQKDESSVRCALTNDFFRSDNIVQHLYKVFWDKAGKYFWVGYHVTRIQSDDEILRNGLVRLEYDSYCNRLAKVLQENGIEESEIRYALLRIKKMYDGYLGERKERVCFLHQAACFIEGNLIIWQEIMAVKLQSVHLRIMTGWKKYGMYWWI